MTWTVRVERCGGLGERTMNPRLQEKYENEILPELKEKLGRTNRLSLPRLEKIVLNMGVGSAIQEKKHLEEKMRKLKAEWVLARELMSQKFAAFESRLEDKMNKLVDDVEKENIPLEEKIDQEKEKFAVRKKEFREKVAKKREEAAVHWQEFGGDLEKYYDSKVRMAMEFRTA